MHWLFGRFSFDHQFFAKHSLHFGSKVWFREHTPHLANAGLNFFCKLIRSGYLAALPSCHYHLKLKSENRWKCHEKWHTFFFLQKYRNIWQLNYNSRKVEFYTQKSKNTVLRYILSLFSLTNLQFFKLIIVFQKNTMFFIKKPWTRIVQYDFCLIWHQRIFHTNLLSLKSYRFHLFITAESVT